MTISARADLSTLIADTTLDTGAAGPLSPVDPSAIFTSSLVRPNGSTNLPEQPIGDSALFMTLANENDLDAATATPSNFFTIRLDPLTGRSRVFRP